MKNLSCIVQAGHLAYSEEAAFLCSVCGNGIVVTLRDRVLSIGGMAHVVFPKLEINQKPTNFYVDVAIRSLLKILFKLGTESFIDIDAQIFGGGHQNDQGKERAQECIRLIHKMLNEKKIRIVSEDVGGKLGRKIVFNTLTGETAAIKTPKIRRMDWIPEWEHEIGVKRIAFTRGE